MLTACGLTTPVTVTIASVPEYVLYVFFQISKHVTFYVFRMDVSKSRKKSSAKFSKQSFKMSSHTSLSNHCNSSGFFIDISKQMAFEIKELAGYTLTLLHSKMFDVCDLPVLTFGNCVLKTGVTKWPPKLFFVTFFYLFFKIPKHDFLRFWSWCTRFLERRLLYHLLLQEA